MLASFLAIDKAVLLAINGAANPFLDKLMHLFSWKHSWLLYLPFLLLVYKKFNAKITAITALGILVIFALCDLISSRFFKPVFERLRPCHEPSLQNLLHTYDGCGGAYGFLSSHAANHVGISFFICLVLRDKVGNKIFLLILFPFLIAYSRVYLGVHYPSDVLAGALLGGSIAFVIWRVTKRYFTR